MFTKEDIEFKFNKNSWGYDKIRDIVGEQTDIFSIIMNCKNQFLDSSRDGQKNVTFFPDDKLWCGCRRGNDNDE